MMIVKGRANLLGLGVALALRTLGQEAHMNIAQHVESRTRSLDEGDLERLTNHELDDIFRASPAGELPAGVVRGTAFVFNGTVACRIIAKLAYWFFWQGKKLDPDRRGLVNRISPLRLPLIRATVYHGSSWVDDKECTVIDYSKTSVVARMVRDETRLVAPGLHLGVVWLWRRRVAWFSLRAPRH
jgi:hypothetical protein